MYLASRNKLWQYGRGGEATHARSVGMSKTIVRLHEKIPQEMTLICVIGSIHSGKATNAIPRVNYSKYRR